VYRDELAIACSRVKGPAVRLAAALGKLTWNFHESEFQSEPIHGVVPIPRRWWQALRHPHHAADTLANVWGDCLQAPVLTSILKKVRWTPQQTTLSPTDRRKNLRDAFAAAIPPSWEGKTLLLADDVMTTGATVQEATKALLRAGIGRVIVAVVGRGLGQRHTPR
jgi:predicted amidophosphoribosyltransferase